MKRLFTLFCFAALLTTLTTQATSKSPTANDNQTNVLLKVKGELIASKAILEELKNNNSKALSGQTISWRIAKETGYALTASSIGAIIFYNLFAQKSSSFKEVAFKITMFSFISLPIPVVHALMKLLTSSPTDLNESKDRIDQSLEIINEALHVIDQQQYQVN